MRERTQTQLASQKLCLFTLLISYDIKSSTCYGCDVMPEFVYGKCLIVSFWSASAAYQARLVSPWVFWFEYVSPNYKPYLDQTHMIAFVETYTLTKSFLAFLGVKAHVIGKVLA